MSDTMSPVEPIHVNAIGGIGLFSKRQKPRTTEESAKDAIGKFYNFRRVYLDTSLSKIGLHNIVQPVL